MTPELAKELLDAATPGPWERRQCGERHGYGGAPLCGAEIVGPIHAECIDAATADLAAAAPALAELVAGLRYEYAVQVKEGRGYTQYASSYRSLTTELKDALWEDEPNRALAERWWARLPTCTVRVVRRLVGDPEVAE